MLVDSHCHVSASWYEPVETLLYHMDKNGVSHAVLVQMLGQFDNGYQQAAVTKYPNRFASVVAVDHACDDAVHQLRTFAEQGAAGLRLRPTARSHGDDPLAIWRAAQDCDMAVSCVGSTLTFATAQFAELIDALPRLRIVLEHLGGSSRPDADDEERSARQSVFALARFDNVYLKVPGLGELLARPPALPSSGNPFGLTTPQLLREALAAFGAERLMWGSDFPMVSSREGYANALDLCRNALADRSSAERASIFGDVARRIFRLSM